jgi:hypothetical protein
MSNLPGSGRNVRGGSPNPNLADRSRPTVWSDPGVVPFGSPSHTAEHPQGRERSRNEDSSTTVTTAVPARAGRAGRTGWWTVARRALTLRRRNRSRRWRPGLRRGGTWSPSGWSRDRPHRRLRCAGAVTSGAAAPSLSGGVWSPLGALWTAPGGLHDLGHRLRGPLAGLVHPGGHEVVPPTGFEPVLPP